MKLRRLLSNLIADLAGRRRLTIGMEALLVRLPRQRRLRVLAEQGKTRGDDQADLLQAGPPYDLPLLQGKGRIYRRAWNDSMPRVSERQPTGKHHLAAIRVLRYDPPPLWGEQSGASRYAKSVGLTFVVGSGMEYQFRPIGKKCAATGADLVPGSLCHSILVERNGELQRLDYSEQGWTGPPPEAIGVWTSQVPGTLETRQEPLDTNALMHCFEQLSEEANPARDGLRYILALLLVKKRRLKLDSTRADGDADFLQLSGAHGEGVWEVQDPNPTDEDVLQWQRELNIYLASEWQTAPPPDG